MKFHYRNSSIAQTPSSLFILLLILNFLHPILAYSLLHIYQLYKFCNSSSFIPESNRERIAFGPLLNTVLYLALKKTGFSKKKILHKKKNIFFTFFLCNFSVRTLWCFQKNFTIFFDPEKVKKQAKKVAHNRPRPFFKTVQPRPKPTAQIFISVL